MKKTIFLVTGFSLLSLMLPFEALAATFSKMYVFGDSLSDTGNEYNITTFAQQFVDPTTAIDPLSPPAFEGRDSNGPLWVDYIAENLGLTLTPSTELAVGTPINTTPNGFGINFSYGGATTTQSVNFAIGGAETGFDNATDPRLSGVLREIQGYTDDLRVANSSADSDALYIVWAGANDYQSAELLQTSVAVGNIATAVTSLYNVGARNFLVPNLPDLGKTPLALSLGTEASAGLTALTEDHNSRLDTTLDGLSQSLTDINLISPNFNFLVNDQIGSPKEFGLTNVTEACLTGEYPAFSVCDNPDEHLFWDNIHLTGVTNARIGEFASAALTSEPKRVPEPSNAVFGIISVFCAGIYMAAKRKVNKMSDRVS